MKELSFKEGVKDAVPIFLGYLAVSLTFGVAAIAYGFPVWVPLILSFTNFTGAGQALGIQLLSIAATTLIELLFAMIIINLRYSLMSISISQVLSSKVKLWQRFILAFGVTDEIFAVIISKNKEISFKYMIGAILCAYFGWLIGTFLGVLAGNFLPSVVMTAFCIALPAMFVAIIIPPCKTNYKILCVVLIGTALSCMFYFVPVLNNLPKGWVYIICGVVSAIIGSILFPVKEENV